MGLKKIGEATAPRSFGTGGAKITPKNNVPNTLNNAQSTYKPSYQKKSAFDRLFDLANEVASTSMPKSAPKFALPTTASGIVRKANSDQFKTDPLDADKALSQKNLEETRKNMRLASARANVARRSGYAVNGIDLQQEQNKLSDLRKQAQGYQKDIDRVDYVQHFQDIKQDDDFFGQFWASYDMGRLGQDEALAWNDYLNNPTPQNRRYAEAVSEQAVLYQQRNQEALDNDAILPWITQDLARYIPQFIDQNIAGLKGLAGGAATGTVIPLIGTAVGGKIGYVAGRAAYGYDTMRGIAFKSLLDAGVDEETARAAANDEAFISSLIEGGDAAVDLLTLGGGKLIGSIFKEGAKTGAQVTKPMWKKILSGGASVLSNAAGEGAQEWTQEAVSLANQQREGSGLLDLVGATGSQIYDALSGQDPDALAQMNEAGAAGFRIGLMMGGGTKIANTALAAALNRSDQNQSGNVTLEQMADEIASDWANQTFGSYQDDSISFSQPTEQIQTQQEVPLLDRLRQQTSTLSNRQAEQVLSDRDAVATLQQKAGLDLSAQTTLAQRQTAVKQSFEQYAAQQQQAQADQNRADMMNSLGENGKKAFVSAVRQTGDADATYPEFARAYAAGLSGSDQTADLSPAAQSAYYAGQNDAATRAEVKAPTMTAGFTESEYSGDLSESDRAFYDVLGKATGTKISVVAPTGDGGYNGYYQDGEIRIAADAEEPGQVVVAHEATHRLQEIAPEAYTKFRGYAVAAVAGQGGADALISAYQSRYADVGVTLTRDAAMDEIAADYAQRLMIDEEAIRRVVSDDRSLAQKFVDTIKDLIQRVKQAFSGKEARAQIAQLEKARDLWLDALKKGSASVESGTQESDGGSVDYSLKGTSQLQRQVQNLQERNAYLKEQMKRSTSIKTDRKKTATYAKRLLKAYESQYGSDALTSDLLSIYDEIANAGSDVDMDSLTASARDVAGRILEQSVREDAELYNEYSALRNYLRTTKINVPKSIHADLDMVGGYNQFRKSNMGRMKLSSSDGASIDTVYQELAQQYPGLFDETAYTNPADQLINMADVLDGIQPIVENPYSSDMEMATRFVASEILESYFDIPQQKPTFADRQQARVESAKAAGNRRVAELRESNRQNIAGIREQNRERVSAMRASNQQRIAQLREQGRQQVKNAIQRERAKRAEQIQALKEKYASKESAGRERRASREVRNKIERHVRAISQKLLTPTDKSNVPEALRKPVAALLDAINLESAYTVDPETGKRVKGGSGDPVKRTAAFMDLRKAYQEIMSSADGDMVVDPALLGDQASGFEGNFDKVIALRDKRLSDMSLTELDTVWQTVRAIEHSISTAGKNLAQSKFAGTVDWAKAMQSENAGRTQRSSTKRHWTLDLLTPITYFSRFGDSGVEVYRMLRNAQDRQQQMITDIRETTREIVSPSDARKYRYETHEFVTDGGQELTLTTAQIMSIYELSKRKQAQGHLLSGGIYQPEVPGTKIRRGTEAIHLTQGDLATIVGTLTDKQAKVADELQKVMATTLADWGNDASMKAYGYKKFTGADYWPISVAREGVKTTVENSGMNTRSISNIGLAKATVPKASNPLNIEDAFSTFTQHAGDMTDYAAYLLPMEDISRLFNFRFKDGDGNYTGQTIKGLLNRVGGAQSDSYWIRLVDDIQNGTAARTDSQFSAGIQNIIGKAKGAAVGANLRVVAQQPTAFFRAAAILSPADLSRGVAGAPTKGSGWAKALKWAPIAQRKQIGGFEIGNGVRLETELFGDLSQGGKRALNKLDDISSTPAAKADQITWGRIWNACEWQISKNKSLAKGSDEYYQATAKLFTRVIDESQVVDGVLQRSQIMRSNSALNKMATSFMGEPTMSLNMMMRAWDAMRYETDPQKRNATRRKFARAGTALVVSGVVNAMVQSLVDAERDKDQDKKYWDRVFSAFTGLTGEEETPWDRAVAVVLNSNVSGNINPLGQIPYVKDVLSLLQGYDVTRMDADAIGDFITAGEAVAKNIGGDGPRTPAYAAKELLNAGAKVFGISIGNLWRDASGIVNAIAVETDNTALMYEMAKAGYNLSNTTNKSRFLDIAFRAREAGDTETYSRIAEDLISSGTVVDMDEFEKAMASRLKKTEAFAKAQASTQEELQKKIESTSIYSRFDSKTKEKAAEKIEAYAYAKQMGEENPDFDLPDSYNWVEKADSGASVGLTPDEYILFDLAYNMLKSDEEEGGLSKQEKAIDLLEGMNLTDSERSYLFGTKYESDKNNPWK